MLYGFVFGGGALFGGIAIGFIANKKPEWFAQVVKAANAVDAKVNATVGKAP